MRVLWVSLLLVGSITCEPLYPGSGFPSSYTTTYSGDSQEPSDKPAGQLGSGSSGFSSFGSQPTGSFSSYGTLSQPGYSEPSSFRPAAGSGVFSSGSQQGSQSGSAGSHQQSAQGGWGSSSDGDQEPDFTSVSPGNQVYARKSRSHYKKHNYRFFQQFYTQTEPVEPQGPMFPHHGKTSGHSKGQVQKGF